MKQLQSLSIVNMKISREDEPFKNETPAVFKLLTNVKTYTEGTSMNASFSTSANLTKNSCKYITLNIPLSAIIPDVKKKDFNNPYLFAKKPKSNGGKISESNFANGFKIENTKLNKQRKHYEKHLKNSNNEAQFKDSKANKSRKYAQYLNCSNPITNPKLVVGGGHSKKHYHQEQSNPTPILITMNKRILGDKFIESRKEIRLSDLRNFQDQRSQREYSEVNDGNRRIKDQKQLNQMKNILHYELGRKQRSSSSFNQGVNNFSFHTW